MLKLVYEVPVNSPDAFRPLSVFRLPARVSHRKLSFKKIKKKKRDFISSIFSSFHRIKFSIVTRRNEEGKKRRRRRRKAIFLTFQSIARPISIHLQLKACFSPLSSVVINISIQQAFNRGSRPVRGTARRGE